MPAHNRAAEIVELQKLAHLVGVPRRQYDFVSFVSQSLNDRNEEWDVGRIVEIDPDPLRRARFQTANALPFRIPSECRLTRICVQVLCKLHRDRLSLPIEPKSMRAEVKLK